MKQKHNALFAFLTSCISVLALGVYLVATSHVTPLAQQPATVTASPQLSPSAQIETASHSAGVLGAQTQTSSCVIQGPYPDPNCTPGAIIPSATKEQICTPGYSSGVRNVPVSEKDQAYAEYGITSHQTGEYEVDHFVSLELGGSNDISNLWPEAATPTPGFHEKDKVENYLHAQVCNGSLTLEEAQTEIRTDWLKVYASMPQ